MEFLKDFDIYPKLIVALSGLIALFIKIKDAYSPTRTKQNIKLDLEIYEMIKNNNDFNKADLKRTIEGNIKKSMNKDGSGLINFTVGLAVFVGFGLWTINIYQTYESFNGWIILTLFCSMVGFSMLFGEEDEKESKATFYQIGFYDKSNFVFALVMLGITGVLTPVLILKIDKLSFWPFLTGLFFIVALVNLFKNIKKIS